MYQVTTSVIFNCSNAVRGGALKNAILFIEHSFNDSTVTWFYLVNQKVLEQCPMLQSLPSCRYRVIRHKLSANPFQYLVSLLFFLISSQLGLCIQWLVQSLYPIFLLTIWVLVTPI